MSGLLARPLVAVASPDDAVATAEAIEARADEFGEVTLVHVVEKAGGAIDKASVEQRKDHAEEAFEAFRTAAPGVSVDTEIAYATDVAEGILETARSLDASAIVFTSRGGGWLVDLLSGNVSDDLLEKSEFPILALPRPAGGGKS